MPGRARVSRAGAASRQRELGKVVHGKFVFAGTPKVRARLAITRGTVQSLAYFALSHQMKIQT